MWLFTGGRVAFTRGARAGRAWVSSSFQRLCRSLLSSTVVCLVTGYSPSTRSRLMQRGSLGRGHEAEAVRLRRQCERHPCLCQAPQNPSVGR